MGYKALGEPEVSGNVILSTTNGQTGMVDITEKKLPPKTHHFFIFI